MPEAGKTTRKTSAKRATRGGATIAKEQLRILKNLVKDGGGLIREDIAKVVEE